MARLSWDSTISNDGTDFKLLEPGTYPFTIKSVEKSMSTSQRFNGTPMAIVTLRVGVGADSADVIDRIILDTDLEWKICQFFRAIGARGHGDSYQMNWDESYLVGKTGFVEIENREYQSNGETRHTNQVARYLDMGATPASDAGATW